VRLPRKSTCSEENFLDPARRIETALQPILIYTAPQNKAAEYARLSKSMSPTANCRKIARN
jgi:hypothetical protein